MSEQQLVRGRACRGCGNPIPMERLEALPETEWCVGCSPVKARKGYMVVSHKTGSEFVAIPSEDAEAIRRADRANRRAR